jgi:UDP-N-acetylmuramate--alanine ligase
VPIYRYGFSDSDDYIAKDVSGQQAVQNLQPISMTKNGEFVVPTYGKHNILNALAVAADTSRWF